MRYDLMGIAILYNLLNMLGLYGAWALVQMLKLFGVI